MQLRRARDQVLPSNFQANSLLDRIPCPMAVWSADGLVCTPNELTLRLTGYSAQDFQEAPASLWISRIHPLDSSVFLNARKRLESDGNPVSCEYRFFPKGSQERWLKETCRTIQRGGGENMEIISVYSDVSDLVALRESKDDGIRIVQVRQVIDRIIHQVTNNLQVIRGTLDYFSLPLPGMSAKEYLALESRIEQTNELMIELSNCCRLPDCEAIDSGPGHYAGKVGAAQKE